MAAASWACQPRAHVRRQFSAATRVSTTRKVGMRPETCAPSVAPATTRLALGANDDLHALHRVVADPVPVPLGRERLDVAGFVGGAAAELVVAGRRIPVEVPAPPRVFAHRVAK